MREFALWQFLLDALEREERAALLLVVESRGSSPAIAGAKLALAADGSSLGTIGGGVMEFDLERLARGYLAESGSPALHVFGRHHDRRHAEASGHICGGFQRVLLWLCNRGDRPLLKALRDRQFECRSAVLTLTAEGASMEEWRGEPRRPVFEYANRHRWRYRETIGLVKRAYIVGGGHVGRALAELLAQMDFQVTVFDTREGVATMLDQASARVRIVTDYGDIERYIPEGAGSYVFVMTHGHDTDQLAMGRLAGREFRYLGLLGSRRKIDTIRRNLTASIDPEVWAGIHAPLGLPIHSKTPFEIAVSIAAELIRLEHDGSDAESVVTLLSSGGNSN